LQQFDPVGDTVPIEILVACERIVAGPGQAVGLDLVGVGNAVVVEVGPHRLRDGVLLHVGRPLISDACHKISEGGCLEEVDRPVGGVRQLPGAGSGRHRCGAVEGVVDPQARVVVCPCETHRSRAGVGVTRGQNKRVGSTDIRRRRGGGQGQVGDRFDPSGDRDLVIPESSIELYFDRVLRQRLGESDRRL